MLEKLKELFRRRAPEVEYRSETDDMPVMPAGPPTTPYPPAVPLQRPDAEPDDHVDRP